VGIERLSCFGTINGDEDRGVEGYAANTFLLPRLAFSSNDTILSALSIDK
jgi:hypothetical protein